MTGYELQSILNNYDKPPTHQNKSEVFSLYYRVTGKQANRNCLNCAIECFLELKYLAKDYIDREIPLSLQKKRVKMEAINPKLTKYRIPKPFRVFGDPRVYNNENATDEEIEFLISYNSALVSNIEFVQVEEDSSVTIEEDIITESSIDSEPKKRGRKKRIAENG